MKSRLFIPILIFLFIPLSPAQAEPKSCKKFAVTYDEKNAVEILQEMYFVQSNLEIEQHKLDEFNLYLVERPDRTDANAVAQYNSLVREYNNLAKATNRISDEYNNLKNEYNTFVNDISPTQNIAFANCLNSELASIRGNTHRLNMDSLDRSISNLQNRTKNLQKESENLQYSLNQLKQ